MFPLMLSLMFMLVERPSSTIAAPYCKAEWCNPNHEPYPNIGSIMTGYNILQGNPFTSSALHDPGFSTGYIFVPTYKTSSGAYALHGGVTVRQGVQCSLSSSSDIITTVEDYAKKIGAKSSQGSSFTSNLQFEVSAELKGVGVKTTIPPLIESAFSSSKEYKNNEIFFIQKRGVLTVHDATCATYTVRISPFDPPPFADGFVNGLIKLNNSIESKRELVANDFIREFGTHYLLQTTMGARTAVSRRYSQDEFKKSTDDQIQKCNEDRLKLTIAGIGNGRTSQSCKDIDNAASSNTVDGFERESVTSYGSKPAADLVSWSQQNFESPSPIKMELSSLLNLFTADHMNKHPSINYKAILKWFGPLYYNYCEKNKVELGIKSCDPQTQNSCGWNDNCIPRQQVCNNNPNKIGFTCCTPKCQLLPCKNGGTCKDITDITCTYQCSCPRGWQGTTCEEKVVFDDILRAEVERQMMLNSAKTNDEFRDILHRYLTGLYSNYFFTVNAYDEVIGSEAHSVIGTYVQFIKTHKRNLVVGWAKKNSVFPPTAKLNEISAAVHRSVNGFNKEAKASAEKAWGVANSFKFPLVMTHVVRFGCGLRSKFSGVTSFQNFTVGGHDSSVVVMFGSP
ncbi:uncharacterized protein LOC100215110 [Hydra vulgaris]|uniref:uncharacterized protein LOC100215110 n=1 Tax=Hydra vulgaris TaxID=6087 RepID=UPI0001927374|nr:uncharacterized protein LOC100215110 [Hydra vulgaris]